MSGLLEMVRAALPGARVSQVRPGPPAGRAAHLTVVGEDGAEQAAVLKPASPRELALYQAGLDPAATGAPALLGWAPGPGGTAWLLLEGLPEVFPDLADPAAVTLAFRHLAAFHTAYKGRPPGPATAPGSPWLVDAAQVSAVLGAFPETMCLASEATEQLAGGPTTLVHGDYHRWNLLRQGPGVRVIDWEQAARAHPVWDLVLLAPEEPGWDGVPRGPMAELALRTYREAGPLSHLPWPSFLRLQRLARLFVAARWARVHEARAAAAPPGAAAVIREHARREKARVFALASLLHP
jgi:hypothetical protein